MNRAEARKSFYFLASSFKMLSVNEKLTKSQK